MQIYSLLNLIAATSVAVDFLFMKTVALASVFFFTAVVMCGACLYFGHTGHTGNAHAFGLALSGAMVVLSGVFEFLAIYGLRNVPFRDEFATCHPPGDLIAHLDCDVARVTQIALIFFFIFLGVCAAVTYVFHLEIPIPILSPVVFTCIVRALCSRGSWIRIIHS
eukprot:Gregarina_sp_Poly_1__7269@NODE_39_length_18147_cov_101_572069_g34_i0_p14_GENE_NODE_39_length_18147_cov_101_572069_g34_i0NODE_39_length_18147_cov_101_572069_g34_i0_p14_ORF_typecomplete_len165_score20_11DUF872/PF05915_12/0_19DUF872/PF05915_12/84MFS_MOT1/PF16983_5/1_3MFS_MOT1/PF16983_5/2_1e02_NODE_39_length_18147_cov_101_572069_g34_i01132811822